MQDANMEAQQDGAAQRDRSANGTVHHQPDSAEEDRYVATAYSEGEDQDERCALCLCSVVHITLLTDIAYIAIIQDAVVFGAVQTLH